MKKNIIAVILPKEEYEELKQLTHHGEMAGVIREMVRKWIGEKKREIALLEAIEKNPQMRKEIEEILKASGSID